MASAGQQTRIAIALAALRHKPPGQSVQAYILDLQAAFPSLTDRECRRAPSPNPWRDRVLALEKDLSELQAQYDNEKLELLALRKAAQTNQSRPAGDAARGDSNPPSDAPASSKKAKAKKTKVPPPPPTSTSTAAPLRLARLPLERRGALLGGILAGVPTASRVEAALEAFDVMADMLPENPLSVSVDLLLSTTVRSLRAIALVLDLLVSRPCVSSSSLHPHSAGSGSGSGPRSTEDTIQNPTAIIDALTASLGCIVSTVLPSLLTHHASILKARAKASRKSAAGRLRALQPQTDATTAIDELLGGLYALVLTPIVRSFAPASEGFASACLVPNPHPGPSPKPGPSGSRTRTHARDAPSLAGVDLRPPLFALLADTLAVLEGVLPGSPAARADASQLRSGTESAQAIAIPGARHVKTLLALECVREVEKLYPPRADASARGAHGPPADVHSHSHPARSSGSSGAAQVSPDTPISKPKDTARKRAREDDGPESGDEARNAAARWTGSGSLRRPGPDAPAQLLRSRRQQVRFPGLAEVLCVHLGDDSTRADSEAHRTHTHTHAHAHARGEPGPGNLGETLCARATTSARERERESVRRAPGETAPARVLGPGPWQACSVSHEESKLPGRARAGAGAVDGDGAGPGDRRGRPGPKEDVVDVGVDVEQMRRERLERLARKDALWYLCAVLQRVLPRGDESESGSGFPMARAAAGCPAGAAAAASADGRSGSGSGSGFGSGPAFGIGIGSPAASPDTLASTPSVADTPSASATPDARACAHTRTLTADTAAEQAVYDALVGLLRRTRPHPTSLSTSTTSAAASSSPAGSSSPSPAASPLRTPSSSSSSSSDLSTQLPKAGGVETDVDMDDPGTPAIDTNPVGYLRAAEAGMGMGEVERGMLLAVLERAWLGI